MEIKLFQVDAFSGELFHGNPAAVCLLEHWIDDELLQQIAAENNLSETAFVVAGKEGYQIRWFTPLTEVALCGHATLASAHVLIRHLGMMNLPILFNSRYSGLLKVSEFNGWLTLDFPADVPQPALPPEGLIQAIGNKPAEIYRGKTDYLLFYPSQEDIEELMPDFTALAKIDARGVIVTAPGYDCDFVSRFFAPKVGVNEDPVTGSAHTLLTPFWAHRLSQLELEAMQISIRGGELKCRLNGDRVLISGQAITFFETSFHLKTDNELY